MALASISPDGKHIWLEALRTQKDLATLISGASWKNKHEIWQLPLSWATCVCLRGVFKDGLEIAPDLAAWAQNELETRINPSLEWRERTDGPGPDNLYDFQRADVQFLVTAEKALLFNGLGSGKTLAAVYSLKEIYNRGINPFPALIVTPNSCKINWEREIHKHWADGPVTQVISGSATQRRKQFEHNPDVYIINWESLRGHSRLAPYGSVALKKCKECGGVDEKITTTKCHTCLKELNHIEFNTVIADEIQRACTPVALSTRSLWSATGDARYRWGLSGTPITDAPDDLWSPLHWLSPEEFSSRTKFIDYFCQVEQNFWGQVKVTGLRPETKDQFFRIIDARTRRMPKDLVLKHLPPVLTQRRDVEMNPKQAKAYKQMTDRQIAEIDGELVTASSPQVRMIRQLQFASSYAELEEYEKVNTETGQTETHTRVLLADPSCKIDAFMEDLDDFDEEDSIVVASPSRQLIELLSERLTKKEITHGLVTGAISESDRQYYVDRFQAGKDRLLLLTTGAGGTGITLTRARVLVFLSRPWSNIDSLQTEGRVHRIGSEIHDSILIVDYVTQDTVEDRVHEALKDKGDRLEEILRDKDLLRRMLSGEDK